MTRNRITLLLVEQNAKAAFRIASRGYVLEAGGVMAGALEEQPSYDDVRRVYLGENRYLAWDAV
ncbi:MAG: hypothetical protein HY726_01065 [Candidatus Rokubacteria bacterium]|nr:hypothetical protein [Candidatus Rokubacteria bacterium]